MNVDATMHDGVIERGGEGAPFAESLLGRTRGDGWQEAGQRLLTGLGLGALFGVALGLRVGGAAPITHAIGVSAAMLSVAAVAVPAFAIVLGLADAPIDGVALARAASRAAAKAGLLLAGLAPAAALYVLTVEDAITVTVVGTGALLLAGAIAARSFTDDLSVPLRDTSRGTHAATKLAIPAFLAFAAALFLRVAWMTLPILRGGL